MSNEATSSVVPNAQTFQAIFIGATQNLSFTGTSAQSSATQSTTSIVRLCSNSDCYIAIGANPIATTSGCLLQAGLTEYFACNAGDKIAAIQKTAGGTLNITEGA